MTLHQNKKDQNSDEQTMESNVLPATEIASNPNPRANENIRERTEHPEKNENDDQVGSEITDGEDA